MTYREEIRQLDSLATPGPWASDGELYGVRDGGSFLPLGFAPHRPLDCRLIAVYRLAAARVIDAVDAIEGLALRAIANHSAPAAIGIRQILTILDGMDCDGIPFRRNMAELDRMTTPPPWDPGHLVLGMEFNAELRVLGIATPRPSDPLFIATARIAVPRGLALLAFAEGTIAHHGLTDGCLRSEGAEGLANAVAIFDLHRAGEGNGTGTV